VSEKVFDKRRDIAGRLEAQFLKKYFGPSKDIQQFALRLIIAGERGASLDLNKFVSVMGSSASAADIIALVRKKHPGTPNRSAQQRSAEGKASTRVWPPAMLGLAETIYDLNRERSQREIVDAAKSLAEAFGAEGTREVRSYLGGWRVEISWNGVRRTISRDHFVTWVRSAIAYNILHGLPLDRIPPP
jgi:hypothetical protein